MDSPSNQWTLGRRGGLLPPARELRIIGQNLTPKAHGQMRMPEPETKVCRGCGKAKPLSDYWHHPSTPDGLQLRCIECIKTARGKQKRTPLSRGQVDLLLAMLELLPETVVSVSSPPDECISEEVMRQLNPGFRNIGRLITKGIIERNETTSPDGKKIRTYCLSEDGRLIAKGMEALARRTSED